MTETSDSDKTQELIESGAEIIGASAGAAVGLLVGPAGVIPGAAGGVLATQSLKKIGAELHGRLLGPRQRARIGAAAALAVQGISQKQAEGVTVRDDGFFDYRRLTRPSSEEILEGVLLSAGDAFEEKKLPHIAAIYVNTAYSDAAPATANLILQYVKQMTYRQMVILACILRADHFRLGDHNYGHFIGNLNDLAVVHEMLQLYQWGLLTKVSAEPNTTEIIISVSDIVPRRMVLNGLGHVMNFMLDLATIPEEDIEKLVASHLRTR